MVTFEAGRPPRMRPTKPRLTSRISGHAMRSLYHMDIRTNAQSLRSVHILHMVHPPIGFKDVEMEGLR